MRAYITDEQRKELDKERKREYREHDEYREYQKVYHKIYYGKNREKIIENMKQNYYNKKNKTDSSSDDSTECI